MKYLTLNTGGQIPVVGSGTNTFGKVNHQYTGEINNDLTELNQAIALGYRHFDTAISYRNEAVVGRAVSESGLPRTAFFLTTKLPGNPDFTKNAETIHEAIQASINHLQTTYIDLFLIHHPWEDLADMSRVWQILENYVDKGVLKAIGVSNFNEEQLIYLKKHARIIPAVNQIESHPGKWQTSLINATQEQGVIVEAWGPLTRIPDEAKKKLQIIGDKYGKTWAQVVLRAQIERNVVVIPKSHHALRQEENLAVFDFSLNKTDQAVVFSL